MELVPTGQKPDGSRSTRFGKPWTVGVLLFAFHELQTVGTRSNFGQEPYLTTAMLLGFPGALVTIVALAIDPFSQQVIKYTFCRQSVNNLGASVAVANNYTQAIGALDLQMASAAYVGILNPAANASAAIPFICETGNCTFSDNQNTNKATHESLAMCGECKDISKSIIKKHLNESGAEHGGYPIYVLFATEPHSGKYALPPRR